MTPGRPLLDRTGGIAPQCPNMLDRAGRSNIVDRRPGPEEPLFQAASVAGPFEQHIDHSERRTERRKKRSAPSTASTSTRCTSASTSLARFPITKPTAKQARSASCEFTAPSYVKACRPLPSGTCPPAAGEVIHVRPGYRAHYRDDRGTKLQVWQPLDGDGPPPGSGVNTLWRFFQGPQSAASGRIPRYVYLDDKAAYDVLHSNRYTKGQRSIYWVKDFAQNGDIIISRPNRGRPALTPDLVTGHERVAAVVMPGSVGSIEYTFRGESGGFGRWSFDMQPRLSETTLVEQRRVNLPLFGNSDRTQILKQITTPVIGPAHQHAPLRATKSKNRTNSKADWDAWTPIRGMLAGESKQTMERKRRYQQAYPQPPLASKKRLLSSPARAGAVAEGGQPPAQGGNNHGVQAPIDHGISNGPVDTPRFTMSRRAICFPQGSESSKRLQAALGCGAKTTKKALVPVTIENSYAPVIFRSEEHVHALLTETHRGADALTEG